MTASPAPLRDIRVLDLTRVLSGPYCTLNLGDLGAEIIKIEEPTRGDDIRGMHISPTLGVSTYFLGLNRNKRSVGLDIRKPGGREVILDLVRLSDVVVENFRAGVMERAGLGYDTLAAVNPAIVYCAISGYGRHGPDKDRPGYDPVVQAESGLMSLTGEPDRDPVRTGVSLVDIITGLYAGQAILAALYERERSGKGQFIDVPLFDTSVNLLSHAASAYLIDGKVMGRVGNSNENAMPVGLYKASDGAFTLAMTSDRQFRKFCRIVLQQPELADDPDFTSNVLRVRNRERLDAILVETFARAPRATWLDRCAEAGIPAGPLRDVAEALDSAEVAGRRLIADTVHSEVGAIRQVRPPTNFSRTPVVEPTAAPTLGEHTESVLRDLLGRDDTAIEALRAGGAIRRRSRY